MLYFDMIELIDVIKESENANLLPYVDSLQDIVDNETD